MNIGDVALASGVSAKMIRYYEATGLVPPADRSASGYRAYDENDVHRLVFVRRARELGFSVPAIRDLLGLWSDRRRSNKEVRAIASRHVVDLKAQAAKLDAMIVTLNALIDACQHNGRPDCPIIRGLAGGENGPVCAKPLTHTRRAPRRRAGF